MLGKKLIFVLVILCVNCSFSQEKDSTLVALEKQVTVATNDSLKVEALLNLGIYQLRRDFNKISKYHDQISRIIEFSPAYDARSQMGQLLQQKGVYNRKKSNYTVALSRYQESQRIFLELKDSLNLSTNYHNIGVVFEYQRERVKAIDNFKKAIAINKQLHNLKKLADNYNAIADNYFYVEQLDSVQYYFDQAIKNYEFINNEEGIHQVLANQSASLTRRKKHKEALPLQLKNFEYLQTTNKKEALAESHFNLAHLYNQLKQFDKAMFHVNKAIDIAKNEKIGELLSKSY
ncbi:MAG: tetratricopeptide repeat protein, partial [Bacteroidota bacterium]